MLTRTRKRSTKQDTDISGNLHVVHPNHSRGKRIHLGGVNQVLEGSEVVQGSRPELLEEGRQIQQLLLRCPLTLRGFQLFWPLEERTVRMRRVRR